MAEILIILNDITHIDPDTNLLCHKAGDIIEIAEDDHVWGSMEVPPVFRLIKIPTIAISKVFKYVEIYYDEIDQMLRMRIWKFDLVKAKQAAMDILLARPLILDTFHYDGPYDWTWQQAKDFIYDKENEVYETEDIDA